MAKDDKPAGLFGLTERDRASVRLVLAAVYMHSMRDRDNTPETIAERSFEVADAMLEHAEEPLKP